MGGSQKTGVKFSQKLTTVAKSVHELECERMKCMDSLGIVLRINFNE